LTRPLIVPKHLLNLLFAIASLSALASEPRVQLGPPEVVLHDRELGLRYFPDERISIIQTEPDCRVVVAAGISSYLLTGTRMEKLVSATTVLEKGGPGTFDNGYAGIAAVVRGARGELLAYYHAEDQEGLPPIPGGIPGFYCRIGLAVSNDNGQHFEKRGPILSAHSPKNPAGRPDQGIGEPCVLALPGGEFLYAYYSSHERRGGNGVVICLARCRVAASLDVGAWRKYHEGKFTESGFGGLDTRVISGGEMADVLFPDVVFLPAQRRFLMIFCRHYWGSASPDDSSGFYAAFSDDGVQWPAASIQRIWAVPTIAALDCEVAWHPTLVIESSEPDEIKGWLYYGYSERWGHRAPGTPHYLARRRASIIWPR
jgi:hypothetical protein